MDIMKESAFNGKGAPATFITDDSEAEINIMKKIWPSNSNFLFIFHVGQAVWRWLWDSKNGIPNDSRRQLMSYFQSILYAESPACAKEAYLNAIGYIGSCIPTYPLWNAYLMQMWNRTELRCLAFRDESVKGHNTNNFSEVAIRIFKDEVLSRVRAYNVITLIDFCSTTLEGYSTRRLQEFANSRNPGPRLFLEKMKKNSLDSRNPINPEHLKKIQCNESQFSVLSENITYFVDVLSACCSCSAGRLGKFCKHQFAVNYYYNICGKNFPAVGAKEKHEIACLPLGQEAPPVAFYQQFRLNSYDIPTLDSCIDGIAPSTTQSFTASPSSEHDIQLETNEQQEKLIKAFRDTLEKFDPSGPAMEKALMRLKKISSEGQCESMLATLSSNVSLKKSSGVAIRV
ncbi:hypothetical protein AVEN_207801-1 [Araneus ventricosus]|uniref:SWIM-type domain-containing protein n=1 Tax=Araneus ventricosus TaxID=182803 RepID=A0A4Y2BX47_ARAVE|nr:hypothetical protein AVEN_207801-1 [Araneus ventricosus]